MAIPRLIHLSFLLLAILSLANAQSNVLFTNQIVLTERQLSYGDYSFVMQGDCNLVLYKSGKALWHSNTANKGDRCTLRQNDDGLLSIVTDGGNGFSVWDTGAPGSANGQYVTIVHPTGKVSVYGPAVWRTGSSSAKSKVFNSTMLGNIPMVNNILFSGQVLYDDGSLTERNYNLIMQGDCNLVLYNGWQSNTHGNGKYCFLRLDHRGVLTILDDDYSEVWSNRISPGRESEYAAVVNALDGQLVVYGPELWSTRSDTAGLVGLKMVVA